MQLPTQPINAELEELWERRTVWQKTLELSRKQPLGAFGAVVVLVMIFAAVFAEYITVYDPEANAFEVMLRPPGAEYWFGTDQMGRDILTRIIYGARTALFVGLTAAIIGSTVGLVLGVGSAYFAGTFDLLFQRLMDVFMAFPLIILALAVVAIFGTDLIYVIAAITVPFIPRCARVVRSSALAIREIPYIDAARALGFSHTRIILRHMVPNVMAPYLIILTAAVGQAILPRGFAVLPRSRGPGADPGLGPDAAGRCGRVRRKRAVGRGVPGPRDHRRGVRVQPVRRRGARYSRSTIADGIGAGIRMAMAAAFVDAAGRLLVRPRLIW